MSDIGVLGPLTHLHKKLALHPPAGLMLALRSSLCAQAVNLIYEDDAGRITPGHLKQTADHALTLTPASISNACTGQRAAPFVSRVPLGLTHAPGSDCGATAVRKQQRQVIGHRMLARNAAAASCSYLYLLASVADDTLKKVQPHSVATAFASMVLPVPGGPNNITPCSTERARHKVKSKIGLLL